MSISKMKEITTRNLSTWVSETQFSDLLKEHVAGFSKILKIGATSATKAGDNYGAQIMRLNIDFVVKDYSTKSIYLILKMPPAINFTNDLQDFFAREIIMYENFLPDFAQLFKEAGCNVVFAPKFYKIKNNTNCHAILLEDLIARNFKTLDRMQGLDKTHAEFVLRKLAQFHAASVKRAEVKGVYPEVFHKNFYTGKDLAGLKERSKGTLDVFMECVPEYAGSELYQHKIKHILDNFHDLGMTVNQIDGNEFNVLNFGDCWINNILFQYNTSGDIEETYFIDFQICKYGSPAQDLIHFLLSSTQLNIKVEQFDHFINYYYQHLLQSLTLLKCIGRIPTLAELQENLRKYAFRAFSTLMGVCSACFIDPTKARVVDKCVDKTAEDMEFRRLYYANDKFKTHAGVVLSWLNERGLLDF